jgi:hypothetical protein
LDDDGDRSVARPGAGRRHDAGNPRRCAGPPGQLAASRPRNHRARQPAGCAAGAPAPGADREHHPSRRRPANPAAACPVDATAGPKLRGRNLRAGGHATPMDADQPRSRRNLAVPAGLDGAARDISRNPVHRRQGPPRPHPCPRGLRRDECCPRTGSADAGPRQRLALSCHHQCAEQRRVLRQPQPLRRPALQRRTVRRRLDDGACRRPSQASETGRGELRAGAHGAAARTCDGAVARRRPPGAVRPGAQRVSPRPRGKPVTTARDTRFGHRRFHRSLSGRAAWPAGSSRPVRGGRRRRLPLRHSRHHAGGRQ